MQTWVPPWRQREIATTAVVATSTNRGIGLTIDALAIAPRTMPWLISWMRQYVQLKPDRGLDPTFTFFYVLLDSAPDAEADGCVDGKVVLEAGYGGYHLGPPDGVETSAWALVEAIAAFCATQ